MPTAWGLGEGPAPGGGAGHQVGFPKFGGPYWGPCFHKGFLLVSDLYWGVHLFVNPQVAWELVGGWGLSSSLSGLMRLMRGAAMTLQISACFLMAAVGHLLVVKMAHCNNVTSSYPYPNFPHIYICIHIYIYMYIYIRVYIYMCI